MHTLIGQTLDNRYEIKEQIGQGGSSTIFLGHDLHLQRMCAVKKNLDTSPEARRQFEREVRILAGTRHPNLPHVYDYFSTEAGQFMVMEYIEGWSLNQLTRKKPEEVPVSQLLAWIDQVCDALEYLHGQTPSIIHRDVKPANIIIHPDGTAFLVDFGISKLYDKNSKTSIGAHRLTSGYAPPEQYGIGNSKTDFRSDVYAVGATLYALLARRRPPEAIERIAHNVDLPQLISINSDVDRDIDAAIRKAMALAMDERYQTIAEFRRALKKTPLTPADNPATPAKSSLRSMKRVWLTSITLGMVGLMVIGSIAFGQWVLRGDPTPAPTAPAARPPSIAVQPTPTPSATAMPSPTPTHTPTAKRKPTATQIPTRTPTPGITRVSHMLQRGENLYTLAARYRADINEIVGDNGLINNLSLSLGTTITIPSRLDNTNPDYSVYMVEAGDTLFGIAAAFDTSVVSIQIANNIIDSTSLRIGQLLIIPAADQFSTSSQKTCSTRPAAEFINMWKLYQTYLGCPIGTRTIIPQIAEEAFEGGHLFWRSDTGAVYVIYDRDAYTSYPAGLWFQAPAAWRWDGISNPNGIGLNPPSGYAEPVRGFGWLWRTYLGGAHGDLGWALDKEYGFTNMARAQTFENGLMFKGSSDRVYVLLPFGYFASD